MANQHLRILNYIKNNQTITPFEAYDKLGITKLATRISELRGKGLNIKDIWVEDYNRFGDKIKYKKYFI